MGGDFLISFKMPSEELQNQKFWVYDRIPNPFKDGCDNIEVNWRTQPFVETNIFGHIINTPTYIVPTGITKKIIVCLSDFDCSYLVDADGSLLIIEEYCK